MNGLNQIRDAVVRTLTDAGLKAAAAFDPAVEEIAGPVISVDVAETAGKAMAIGGYLGEETVGGSVRELYGRELETTLALDLRACAAAECEDALEKASDALSAGLPSGLRLREEVWKAVEWERENRCFLRRGKLKCSAYFIAQTSEDGVLLDFTLKGVLTN